VWGLMGGLSSSLRVRLPVEDGAQCAGPEHSLGLILAYDEGFRYLACCCAGGQAQVGFPGAISCVGGESCADAVRNSRWRSATLDYLRAGDQALNVRRATTASGWCAGREYVVGKSSWYSQSGLEGWVLSRFK